MELRNLPLSICKVLLVPFPERCVPIWRSHRPIFKIRSLTLCTTHLLHIQLYLFLYGCETQSLTLREEHRLRVFENRVLRRIFGWGMKWQVVGESCIMRSCMVGRPEGRRPLGRPRHRWEDNIKMDLREMGFGDVDWVHLAQDRDRWRALVNTVMNLRVP
jgi:hypothetical protein